MFSRATVAVNTPRIGPIPALSLALYLFPSLFSSCSHPGMHLCKTSGSTSAVKTRWRGAAIVCVPSIFKSKPLPQGTQRNTKVARINASTSRLRPHLSPSWHEVKLTHLRVPSCPLWLNLLFLLSSRDSRLQGSPRIGRGQVLAVLTRGKQVSISLHAVGSVFGGRGKDLGVERFPFQRVLRGSGTIRLG